MSRNLWTYNSKVRNAWTLLLSRQPEPVYTEASLICPAVAIETVTQFSYVKIPEECKSINTANNYDNNNTEQLNNFVSNMTVKGKSLKICWLQLHTKGRLSYSNVAVWARFILLLLLLFLLHFAGFICHCLFEWMSWQTFTHLCRQIWVLAFILRTHTHWHIRRI